MNYSCLNCFSFLVFFFLQVANEPLNTHLISLPNHVGSQQNNGQQTSTAISIPNGKSAPGAVSSLSNKTPSTCTSTSTSVSSPSPKQSTVSNPATQSPGGSSSTNKKHSPTISNLLAPTTGTSTVSSNGVPAIPSPVSSTSSLSSISMPSRLGSTTPPVVPLSSAAVSNSSNTPTTVAAVNKHTSLSLPPVNTQSPLTNVDTNNQSVSTASNVLPLSSPAPLSLPPTLNGPGIPPLAGLAGLPLSPLTAPSYRAIYPYGIYSPYGIPSHPYGIPPTPISSPALSPRAADTRRDSSLVLSKTVRPVTPNSNISAPTSSSNNSSTLSGPNSFNLLGSASNSTPRGYSPTRERDNYRFVAVYSYV